MEFCPQCKSSVNKQNSRLIQDTCGHKKCRLCLLKEEDGCRTCTEEETEKHGTSNVSHEVQSVSMENEPEHNKILTLAHLNKSENTNHENVTGKKNTQYRSETDTEAQDKDEAAKTEKKVQKRQPLIPKSHIMVIQGNPTRYNCMVCKKFFTSKSNVRYHNYCGTENKPFHCDLCDKGFVIRSHYEYHQKIHTGDQPYVCDTCGKGFKQRGKLKRHLKSHSGEKPFICQDCGKDYINNESLRSHQRTHTGERPHTCGDCGRAFTEYSNLKKHQMVHTGEKPYMCEECGRSFTFKWGLEAHQTIHTRERPHSCKFCNRAFGLKKDLKRHLIVHSHDRPHSCSVCSVAFRRKDNLERHMKNTHPETRQAAPPQHLGSNIRKGTSVIRDKSVVPDAMSVKNAESTIVKVQKTFQVPIETDKQIVKTTVFRPIIQLNSQGIKSTLKLPQAKGEVPPKKPPASRTSKRTKKQNENKVEEPLVDFVQADPSGLEMLSAASVREVGTNLVHTNVFKCNTSINNMQDLQDKEVQDCLMSQTGKQIPDNKLERSIESCRAVPVINRSINVITNNTPISTPDQPLHVTKGEQASEGKNHVRTITRASNVINASAPQHNVNTIVKPKPKHKYYSMNTAMPPPLISIASKTNQPILGNYKTRQPNRTNHSVLRTVRKANRPILGMVQKINHPVLTSTRRTHRPILIAPKSNQPVFNIASKVNQPNQPILRMLLSDVNCVDNERNNISAQEMNTSKTYSLIQDTSTNMSSSYDPKLSDVCSPDFLMQARELMKAPTATTITANSPFSTSDYDKRLGYSDDFSVDSQFRASYSQSSIYDSLIESSYMVDDVVSDKGVSPEKPSNISNTLSMIGQLAEYPKFNHIIQNTFVKNKEVGERLQILADVAGTKDAPFSIPPIGQPVIVGTSRKGGNSMMCSDLNL